VSVDIVVYRSCIHDDMIDAVIMIDTANRHPYIVNQLALLIKHLLTKHDADYGHTKYDDDKQTEGQAHTLDDVMSYYECEHTVQTLKNIDIRDYGSRAWLQQHHAMSQLNIQAHINAMMRGDEYVMESLATFDKVRVISHRSSWSSTTWQSAKCGKRNCCRLCEIDS
jgi:hypothetical protein